MKKAKLHLKKYKISDFENLHANEDCLILGSAKSMLDYDFNKFNGKIIACGDSYLRIPKSIKVDYWVVSNNEFPIPEIEEHLKIINSLGLNDTCLIFSDTAAYNTLFIKNQSFWDKNITIKYLHFDERHFGLQKCKPVNNCCNLIKNEPLQDYLLRVFDSNDKFKKSGTVAEHALSFAMIMGFKKIDLQGIEIPKNPSDYIDYPSEYADQVIKRKNLLLSKMYKDYYKNKKIYFKIVFKSILKKLQFFNNYQRADFYLNYENILHNFKILFQLSHKNNIKINICSKTSSLNILKKNLVL